MELKKYKVVCSQPKFSDEIYIDIAPDSGVIHDQIFFSRMQLHKQVDNKPLSRLYGSIYLQDYNGEITVTFPTPQARKNTPDYENIKRRYDKLEQKIVERYKLMRKNNRETTLFLYSLNQMFETSAEKIAEGDAFECRRREKMKAISAKFSSNYAQKHAQQIYAQSYQEERIIQEKENFAAIRERRIEREQKRSSETIPAWLRFQSQYSGD